MTDAPMPDIEAIRTAAEEAALSPERIARATDLANAWEPSIDGINESRMAQDVLDLIAERTALLSLTDSLTAERDELRREVERLKSRCLRHDSDDEPMWQVLIGRDGQIAIPIHWTTVAAGPVLLGDRVLIQGTHAKWWCLVSRDPGVDASEYELVIRPTADQSAQERREGE